MEINFLGEHQTMGRVVLGYHSLDQALKGSNEKLGWPTRTMTEIYGPTGAGKTTFSIDILAQLSKALDNISIACLDLEIQSEEMVNNVLLKSGYLGKAFRWIDAPKKSGKKIDTDEALLAELIEALYETPPYLGMLDSVASLSPIAEQEGDIGDSNMGRRAFTAAQFCRKVIRAFRTIEHPSALIMTNHWYPKMTSLKGIVTYAAPGGQVKENEAQLRIQVKVPYVEYISSGEAKKEARWDEGWVLQGRVEKNRVGTKDKIFQVFIVGGYGIHKGLTDMIDCLASGLASVSSGKVVMDGTDYGHLNAIVAKKRNDEELFIPFANALKSEKDNNVVVDDEEIEEKKPKKRGRPKKDK